MSAPEWRKNARPLEGEPDPRGHVGKAKRDQPKHAPSQKAPDISTQTHSLGWSLIQQKLEEDGQKNVVLSPFSISVALAMVAGGADPECKALLASKLGVADPEQLATAFGGIVRPLIANADDGSLTATNAVFTDSKLMQTEPSFIEYLEHFDAKTQEFPHLATATAAINKWVADHTLNLIRNLLSNQDLKEAVMVLVNAVAFKGKWRDPFKPDRTRPVDFHPSPTDVLQVDMMFKNREEVDFCQEAGYSAVRLPYQAKSPETRMALIAYLPDENYALDELLQQISIKPSTSFMPKKFAPFGFPKFKIESDMRPLEALIALGYPLAGPFPRINVLDPETEIDTVIHKALIDLDEQGTTAVAATAVVMRAGGRPMPVPSLVFDRPFAFSIVAEASGMAIFTGVFMGSS